MEKVFLKSKPTLFHGWGFVDGHWVYIPLWDPSPVDKKFRGFKQLQLASAINDIAKNVASKDLALKLNDITRDLIGQSGKSALVSWEEGDGICPDWWPFPGHPPIGGGGGDPDPVYFPKDISKALVNQLAAHLLVTLAGQVKMPQLKEIGAQLMNIQG